MTQTATLDITKAEERGLTMGLNEFSGYVGVAFDGSSRSPRRGLSRSVSMRWSGRFSPFSL